MALAQMGVQALSALLALWATLPADARSPEAARWLEGAVADAMKRRSTAEQFGRSYYRLVRALATGRTIQDPFLPEPSRVTLAKLRVQFIELASPYTPREGLGGRSLEDAYRRGPSDDTTVTVDPAPQHQARTTATRAAAEQEIRTVLRALGPDNIARRLDDIAQEASRAEEQPSIQEVDQARSDARDAAGRAMSGAGDRVVMNGGRSTVWNYQEEDDLCIGWARISLTGTPCGWCAMLISRGYVYKSERSATSSDRGVFTDGDRYHDYCHCVAVPVFESDDFDTDPRFELNRQYEALWRDLREGRLKNPTDRDGDANLTIWRRYFRNNTG